MNFMKRALDTIDKAVGKVMISAEDLVGETEAPRRVIVFIPKRNLDTSDKLSLKVASACENFKKIFEYSKPMKHLENKEFFSSQREDFQVISKFARTFNFIQEKFLKFVRIFQWFIGTRMQFFQTMSHLNVESILLKGMMETHSSCFVTGYTYQGNFCRSNKEVENICVKEL